MKPPLKHVIDLIEEGQPLCVREIPFPLLANTAPVHVVYQPIYQMTHDFNYF